MIESSKRMFVLISDFEKEDKQHGIDRVVRNILGYWLLSPPDGYNVNPIYTKPNTQGLFYAYKMMRERYGLTNVPCMDAPIEWRKGDFLLIGIDRYKYSDSDNEILFTRMYNDGVSIWFFIHDIIPLLHPEWCTRARVEQFRRSMEIVDRYDGIICVSKSVSNEIRETIFNNKRKQTTIRTFLEGCSIDNKFSSKGITDGSKSLLDSIRNKITFIMVSTLHPRKGYLQAIKAMNQLWASGEDFNLLIVGRKDPRTVAEVVDFIRNNREYNKRLFWVEDASDEYLVQLYKSSTALLFASEAEGFGLPVVEAARYGLPLILRDIPIFRELAGNHAFYFTGTDPSDLATALNEWLKLYADGKHPITDGMKTLSWRESAQMLLNKLGL